MNKEQSNSEVNLSLYRFRKQNEMPK